MAPVISCIRRGAWTNTYHVPNNHRNHHKSSALQRCALVASCFVTLAVDNVCVMSNAMWRFSVMAQRATGVRDVCEVWVVSWRNRFALLSRPPRTTPFGSRSAVSAVSAVDRRVSELERMLETELVSRVASVELLVESRGRSELGSSLEARLCALW